MTQLIGIPIIAKQEIDIVAAKSGHSMVHNVRTAAGIKP